MICSYTSRYINLTRKQEPIIIRGNPLFGQLPAWLVPVATTTWTIPAGISDDCRFAASVGLRIPVLFFWVRLLLLALCIPALVCHSHDSPGDDQTIC